LTGNTKSTVGSISGFRDDPALKLSGQIFFVGAEIFNPQKKRSAKIKCHLFGSKPQKFHTAEITGYTEYIYIVLPKIVEKLKHYKFRLFRNRTKSPQY
jgi:hypothetical protein